MEKKIDEEFVKRSVIHWLSDNDWGKNLRYGGLSDHGVDIRVRHNKYARYFLIEVKGDGNAKNLSSQREVNFNYAIGQIITRMHTKKTKIYKYGYKYGIAFPESFRSVVLRRLPYDVCNKLNLYLFFVNNGGSIDFYDWKRLRELQNLSKD